MSLPFVIPGPGPVVRTPAGAVRGVWREHDGVRSAAFLGIPYAAPPVGPRRFTAPAPPAPWDGERDATAYGPTPQRAALSPVTFIPEPSIPGDDTLSVNVFTPDIAGSAPVLVWFHGGGYVGGSPASPWYDGRSFARDGVVVVTASYRLGFDGFGVLGDAPANRGVLDMVAALRWVRDTVAAFGGDPGRVTIAGQSAGGGAVTTLLVTPAARGLFAGAIAQSGAFGPGSAALGTRLTRRLARALGVESTAAAFAAVDPDDVSAALREVTGDADPLSSARRTLSGGADLPLGPGVDGASVPATLADAAAAGDLADVPLLVGCTAHEFTHQDGPVAAALAGLTPRQALERLGTDPALVDDVLAAHPDLDAPRAVGQALTELIFRRPAARLRELHGPRTWAYDVRWRVPAIDLAPHCVELPFCFDVLDADGVTTSLGPNPPQDLADAVHGAWVRFVRDGDPGWPAVAGTGPDEGAIFGEGGTAVALGPVDPRP